MDIKVKKLYDISQIVVPEELTKWKVTDEQIEEELNKLTKLAATETEADTAEAGDCVALSCVEGTLNDRTVLLYPGLNLPGAEAAEQAVVGLAVGSEAVLELNGPQKLKVEKILRRVPAELTAELIKSQNVDGVATIDEYRQWYRDKAGMENREQALKQINSYYLETLAEKSEFDYDEAELNAWLDAQIQQQMAYMEQALGAEGIAAEGGFTDEDIAAMKQQGKLMPLKTAVEQYLCESNGFTFTADMFEDELKAAAEEMAGMPEMPGMPGVDEMLEQYRDMYVSQAYMTKAAELLAERAQNCLEV